MFWRFSIAFKVRLTIFRNFPARNRRILELVEFPGLDLDLTKSFRSGRMPGGAGFWQVAGEELAEREKQGAETDHSLPGTPTSQNSVVL